MEGLAITMGGFEMEKLEKIGWAFILTVLFAAWAMWYQSSRAAVSLCEADLPACEAAYFANLDR